MTRILFVRPKVQEGQGLKGVPICKQVFLNTIRNPVYVGKIRVKPWKNEPEQITTGLHPPLITEDVFLKANEVLRERCIEWLQTEVIQNQ